MTWSDSGEERPSVEVTEMNQTDAEHLDNYAASETL